jgi:hypothetical protein
MSTSAVTTIVDDHLAALGDPDPASRTPVFERVWAPEGRLVDPPLTGDGRAGLGAVAEAVAAQFPGHRFRRTSGIDAHHDVLRYAWELVGPDGAVAVAGIDVGRLDGSGRLVEIAGFFGELPPHEDSTADGRAATAAG